MKPQRFTRHARRIVPILAAVLTGINPALAADCDLEQPAPYFQSTYPGLHGNPMNNERVWCSGPQERPRQGFHAFQGAIVFNPITVSKRRVYAAITTLDGCRLRYADFFTGREGCLDPDGVLSFGVLGSSPELDRDENIYVADGWEGVEDAIVSFTRDGRLRWRRGFGGLRSQPLETTFPPLGVHLSEQGAATVAPDGLVVVVNMADDAALPEGDSGILAHFHIVEDTARDPNVPDFAPLCGSGQARHWTWQPPPPDGDVFRLGMLCRLEAALGGPVDLDLLLNALAGGTGGSGNYGDNSIALAGDLLFVAGGGPATATDETGPCATNGAIVALRLTDADANRNTLRLAWWVETNGATGSTPTIDPTGRWLVGSDVTPEGFARLVAWDIAHCETLARDAPAVCPLTWSHVLEGRNLNASISVDEEGVVYAWNQGSPEPDDLEILAVRRHGDTAQGELVWGTDLSRGADELARIFKTAPPRNPDDYPIQAEWTSTVLVLNDMVVGQVSHFQGLPLEGAGLPVHFLPWWSVHEFVAIQRFDTPARRAGEVIWRDVPLPDDLSNSPLYASDGSFYAPILGFIDMMTIPATLSRRPETCAEFMRTDAAFAGGIVQLVPPAGVP